jgi:Mrp family chromosome partitioning ATPase/capsular polysaccharide biosynthesis protein
MVVALAAAAFSRVAPKEYAATAHVLVANGGPGTTLLGAAGGTPDVDRQAQTNVQLLRLDVLVDRTAQHVHHPVTPSQITTTASDTSNLLSVTARVTDPTLAAQIANAFASEYLVLRRQSGQALLSATEQNLRRRLAGERVAGRNAAGNAAEIRFIQERLDRLETLRQAQTGDGLVIDQATPPKSPESPRPLRNVVLGAFVGVLLGLVAAFMREAFDPRLREFEEIEDMLGRPVLAVLPYGNGLKQRRWGPALSGPDADRFRTLRMNFAARTAFVSSVLVTSPGHGDGRSTVAWNFAAASATDSRRVLLIEADVRRPCYAATQGLSPQPGLSDVLLGDVNIDDAVQTVVAWDQRVRPDDPPVLMDVLVAGTPRRSVAALLESAEHRLYEAIKGYDFVVVDCPPAASGADTIEFMPIVDTTLVVVRPNHSKRAALAALRDQLVALNASVAGAVINAAPMRAGPGRGYHGFDDGRRPVEIAMPALGERVADRTVTPSDSPRASARR